MSQNYISIYFISKTRRKKYQKFNNNYVYEGFFFFAFLIYYLNFLQECVCFLLKQNIHRKVDKHQMCNFMNFCIANIHSLYVQKREHHQPPKQSPSCPPLNVTTILTSITVDSFCCFSILQKWVYFLLLLLLAYFIQQDVCNSCLCFFVQYSTVRMYYNLHILLLITFAIVFRIWLGPIQRL